MLRKRWFVASALLMVAGLIVVGPIAFRRWMHPVPEFPTDPKLFLLSIDGNLYKEDDPKKPKGELFRRRYPILGEIEITDPVKKRTVLEAVKHSIRRGPNEGAKCFIPRHALRIGNDKEEVELVICFECRWYYLHRSDGQEPVRNTIASDAEPLLNGLLTDAGIPLAPKLHGGESQQ
jgi:hypothetical protein